MGRAQTPPDHRENQLPTLLQRPMVAERSEDRAVQPDTIRTTRYRYWGAAIPSS
jgi:hypothetical protein